MDQEAWLTEQFEENRPRLRGVAYRMLGSLSEAEDAVQEAWLRLQRANTITVENLAGWLTTVVSRVCLDMLRSRKSRREDPIGSQAIEPSVVRGEGADPEGEAVLADSVGVALLVVLDILTPAERLAFVLHDLFALPFDEIGSIVGRSPAAAKQLDSGIGRRQGSSARSGGGVSEGGTRRRPRGPPRRARSRRRRSHRRRGTHTHRCPASGGRHGAGSQGRLDVGETGDRALARPAIRTAGAHQWIGRIDPRAAR